MINKVKDVDIKFINIKIFDPNNIKIDEKAYKNLLYWICDNKRLKICKNL